VDFLPGLVASRVGVFVTEQGQQTHCVLYFLAVYFLVFISAYRWKIKNDIFYLKKIN